MMVDNNADEPGANAQPGDAAGEVHLQEDGMMQFDDSAPREVTSGAPVPWVVACARKPWYHFFILMVCALCVGHFFLEIPGTEIVATLVLIADFCISSWDVRLGGRGCCGSVLGIKLIFDGINVFPKVLDVLLAWCVTEVMNLRILRLLRLTIVIKCCFEIWAIVLLYQAAAQRRLILNNLAAGEP